MATGSSSEWSSALAGGADTIAARATPPGRGALAVIRISGAATRTVAAWVAPAVAWDRARTAQLVGVRDASGSELDQAIVVPYPAPRSATGEDLVEVICHGAPVLVELLLESARRAGARMARPGEFSRRAVANGKLDLVQAEAVRDLIEAETRGQLEAASRQLRGRLSARYGELRRELVDLQARLEAGLDFPAHEVEPEADDLERRRRELVGTVDGLLAAMTAGRTLRSGARVVIAGPANSGKSTLFNALLQREQAIVDPAPGTTRDVLEAETAIGQVPVTLVDTAGDRRSSSAVEREGVRRAEAERATADVVLEVWDGRDRRPGADPAGSEATQVVRVRTKADLGGPVPAGWLAVAAPAGMGLDRLRDRVLEALGQEGWSGDDVVAVDARHRDAIGRAREELVAMRVDEPDLAAEAVRVAIAELEGLVGVVTDEEVLDEVFATFCIGK